MGKLRFRKSFKVAPGVRLNVGKRGVGVSAGAKGLRVGVNSRGAYTSTSIPGTGVSSVNYWSQHKRDRPSIRSAGEAGADDARFLSSTSPWENARELRHLVETMEPPHLRSIVQNRFPALHQARLPLGGLGIAVGTIGLVAQQVWAIFPLIYGVVAVVANRRRLRKMREGLLRVVDDGLAEDEALIEADRERAMALDAPDGLASLQADPSITPDGLLLEADEEVLWVASDAARLKELKGGLKLDGRGELVLTTKRLVFLGDKGVDAVPIARVVHVGVRDDARLTLTLKNRKSPLEFMVLGSANTIATTLRVAFQEQKH